VCRLAESGSPSKRRIGRTRLGQISLGGLDRMIGYLVRRAQLWMIQDFRRALRELDITPAQFSVLNVIAANPGLSQARVSEALAIERARLVQMIDSLEAAGHVEGTRSTTDRRSHALHLTAAGADLLKRARGPVAAHERNVLARISPGDREALRRILSPFLE
jgi:DNA-binding MarR family transcriptional regulator